jgi:hypothetical protein
MLKFSLASSSWADVHYTVNNGGQLNVRMTQSSGSNSYTASGLKSGDVVRYTFTYWDSAKNYAVDTAQQTFTMQ